MSFKVANVIDRFNAESGGPPRTVAQIAAAGAGHWHADLFTTDYTESAADRLLTKEFPGSVHLLPAASQTFRGGLSMVVGTSRHFCAGLLAGVAPDIVHIHGVWTPFLAAFARAAMRDRISFIVAPHGMLEPWSLRVRATRKSIAMALYQRQILARASALHATSETEANNLRQLSVSSAPIFIIPNAVAEPPAPNEAAVEARPDGKRTLLFLSRVHEKKGLDILLEAWNDLRPSKWQLLIVGSGDPRYMERLQHFCKSHRVPDVVFVPHADGELRETLFRQASAFVLPTYSENFGNVIAEALIRGLPVITTTGTPWSDIVARRCGWYIEPTAPELKRVIAEVAATDPTLLAQMGKRGRDYAASHFSLPVVRNGLLTMYESVSGKAAIAHA